MTEFAKLSKKEQKKINNKARGSWNGVNPVSRVAKPKKGGAYDRNREKRNSKDFE